MTFLEETRMLPPDSFLRNAPRAINLETRLQWEVLVNSSDAICYAYENLIKSLETISRLPDQKEAEIYRPKVAIDCWTIIDHSHAFFQIVRKVDRVPNGIMDTLLTKYGEPITLMRNGMDHISEKIRNLSNKKDGSYGVYGSVAFATPLLGNGTYNLVTFSLGGTQFEKQYSTPIDTHAVPEPNNISNIAFAAFDQYVSLSSLANELITALITVDENIRDYAYVELRKFAEANNIEFNKVISETVKGTVYLQFNMTRQ